MNYMLVWTSRSGGSATENEEAAKRALQMYQKWSPPKGVSITEFVARLDGEGGFAVLETDDPALEQTKADILAAVNRVGDAGLAVGMFVMW